MRVASVLDPEQPARIVLVDLEPMVSVGMARVLADAGLDVVVERRDRVSFTAHLERLMPDAVVLRLDGRASRALGERLRAAAPRTKVVFWSRQEDEMEVLDPGESSVRSVRGDLANALLSELGGRPPTTGEQ